MSNEKLDSMSHERAWMIYQILLGRQDIPDTGFTVLEAVQAVAKIVESGNCENVCQSYLN